MKSTAIPTIVAYGAAPARLVEQAVQRVNASRPLAYA